MHIAQKINSVQRSTDEKMSKTVKAREHYGANSLDLTIPTDMVENHELNSGDIFDVNIEQDGDTITISYELVHRSE